MIQRSRAWGSNARLRLGLCLAALPAYAACGGGANLTPEQEYYAGRAFSANVIAKYSKIYDDPVLTEYVYKVGTLLAISSERAETYRGPYRSYTFTIIDTDEVNAFGAPSGFVFITKGLIRKCENEDELAAILAHEVSHIVLHHPEDIAASAKQNADTQKTMAGLGSILSRVGQVTGKDNVKALGEKVVNFSAAMDEVFKDIIEKGFSQEQEFKADALGVDLASRVGYDPLAMKRMLQRLGERKKGVLGWTGDTHPAPQDRVKEIDKLVAQRQAEGRPLRGRVEEVRTQRFKAATASMK